MTAREAELMAEIASKVEQIGERLDDIRLDIAEICMIEEENKSCPKCPSDEA